MRCAVPTCQQQWRKGTFHCGLVCLQWHVYSRGKPLGGAHFSPKLLHNGRVEYPLLKTHGRQQNFRYLLRLLLKKNETHMVVLHCLLPQPQNEVWEKTLKNAAPFEVSDIFWRIYAAIDHCRIGLALLLFVCSWLWLQVLIECHSLKILSIL